jgi:hypothetical protein
MIEIPKRFGWNKGTPDGVYINNTSYTEWERTQAWTFTGIFRAITGGSLQPLFTSKDTGSVRGILISVSPTLGRVQIRNNGGVNGMRIDYSFSSIAGRLNILHVTYSGNSLASGVNAYLNGTLLTPTVVNNNLSATIINSTNTYRIGVGPALVNSFRGVIFNVGFANYVKSAGQITTESTNYIDTEVDPANLLISHNLNYRQGTVVDVIGTNRIATTANIVGQTPGIWAPISKDVG